MMTAILSIKKSSSARLPKITTRETSINPTSRSLNREGLNSVVGEVSRTPGTKESIRVNPSDLRNLFIRKNRLFRSPYNRKQSNLETMIHSMIERKTIRKMKAKMMVVKMMMLEETRLQG
jgi:hypothetical protein